MIPSSPISDPLPPGVEEGLRPIKWHSVAPDPVMATVIFLLILGVCFLSPYTTSGDSKGAACMAIGLMIAATRMNFRIRREAGP